MNTFTKVSEKPFHFTIFVPSHCRFARKPGKALDNKNPVLIRLHDFLLPCYFDIATFLLDNTVIDITLFMFMLILLLIRGLEEKLSIMEKAEKAIAPLVIIFVCAVKGIYNQV